MARNYIDNWAVGSSRPPSTPSLAGTQQQITSQFAPRTPQFRDIPTFNVNYFMPSNTLRQIQNVLNTTPKLNEQQLQQRAQTQTDLLTNPQLDALRRQINAFKALIPQTQQGMERGYRDARQQLSRSAREVEQQALQAAQEQGGLRSGVATELSQLAQEQATPLFAALAADYNAQREQVLGELEVQKENAQNLLDTIQRNRENMTKENYDALRDQAIKQFQEAQRAQVQILQQIAQIEAGARSSSARFQQEAAAAYNQYQAQSAAQYNQFMQRMVDQQLQDVLGSQLQSNLTQWRNYLLGPTVRTAADARRRLQDNREAIIAAVGQDGYNELLKQIERFGPGWVNPRYVGTTVAPSSGSRSSSASSPRPGIVQVSPWIGSLINAIVPSSPVDMFTRNPLERLLDSVRR